MAYFLIILQLTKKIYKSKVFFCFLTKRACQTKYLSYN